MSTSDWHAASVSSTKAWNDVRKRVLASCKLAARSDVGLAESAFIFDESANPIESPFHLGDLSGVCSNTSSGRSSLSTKFQQGEP